MESAGLEDTPIFKLMNGEDAWAKGYPFQASILHNNEHICGAIILNAIFILTAAHCFHGGKSISSLKVKAGEFDRNLVEGNEQERSVAGLFIHESFVEMQFPHDIALLRLSTPLVFGDYVRGIPYYRISSTWSGAATVSGWGSLTLGGDNYHILQKLDIPIVTKAECQSKYGTKAVILDGHICAGEPGKDACRGDSGGPFSGYLLPNYDRIVVGISSFGMPCRNASQTPGVYTNISKYAGWIEQKMRLHTTGTSSTDCKSNEFFCPTERRCIPRSWVSNGRKDCLNGEDENPCPSGKFHCVGTTRCISMTWKCDGDWDCTNGLDEKGCGNCTSDRIRCSSQRTKCIPLSWLCDNDRDCSGGEDERHC